jgi:hypothetical protein
MIGIVFLVPDGDERIVGVALPAPQGTQDLPSPVSRKARNSLVSASFPSALDGKIARSYRTFRERNGTAVGG